MAEDPATAWTSITLSEWYGGKERTVEVASATAVWYSTGLPPVALRWVLMRDPEEEFETQALLCTDLHTDPERIISWFVRRWQMESTFAWLHDYRRLRIRWERDPDMHMAFLTLTCALICRRYLMEF